MSNDPNTNEVQPQTPEQNIPPVDEIPIVTNRVIIDVMTDGSMSVKTAPQIPPWSVVGLLAVLIKNLGG